MRLYLIYLQQFIIGYTNSLSNHYATMFDDAGKSIRIIFSISENVTSIMKSIPLTFGFKINLHTLYFINLVSSVILFLNLKFIFYALTHGLKIDHNYGYFSVFCLWFSNRFANCLNAGFRDFSIYQNNNTEGNEKINIPMVKSFKSYGSVTHSIQVLTMCFFIEARNVMIFSLFFSSLILVGNVFLSNYMYVDIKKRPNIVMNVSQAKLNKNLIEKDKHNPYFAAATLIVLITAINFAQIDTVAAYYLNESRVLTTVLKQIVGQGIISFIYSKTLKNSTAAFLLSPLISGAFFFLMCNKGFYANKLAIMFLGAQFFFRNITLYLLLDNFYWKSNTALGVGMIYDAALQMASNFVYLELVKYNYNADYIFFIINIFSIIFGSFIIGFFYNEKRKQNSIN